MGCATSSLSQKENNDVITNGNKVDNDTQTSTSSSKSEKQKQSYPIHGNGSIIMRKKKYGTSAYGPMSKNLRWNCDYKTANRICNHNRHYAEPSGYFYRTNSLRTNDTTFMKEIESCKKQNIANITFYDSNTSKPLFKAPINRSWDEFIIESKLHGWPSFRDEEVLWDDVRCLRNGECVSLNGTHLGHNLPDRKGNRYCINLVSIAGQKPSSSTVAKTRKAAANDGVDDTNKNTTKTTTTSAVNDRHKYCIVLDGIDGKPIEYNN